MHGRPAKYGPTPNHSGPAPGRSTPAIQPAKTTELVKPAPAAVSKVRSEAEAASTAPAEVPLEKTLHVTGKQPSATDVAGALTEINQAAGEILRAGKLAQLGRTVIVYRGLRVTEIHIKGKRGTAQVEIESLASITGDRMNSQRGWELIRPELQRAKTGWVLTAAARSVYVPRDAALRVLAARLAALTENADSGASREREQAQIIRLLNLLVAEN